MSNRDVLTDVVKTNSAYDESAHKILLKCNEFVICYGNVKKKG